MEYDENTCITAGYFRDIGLYIPETIPDDAWVSKLSVKDFFKIEKTGEQSFKFIYGLEFTEPFKWLNGTFGVEDIK